MPPDLTLAKRRLDSAKAEFQQLLDFETEIVPSIAAKAAPISTAATNALRASAIEGVYTGIEVIRCAGVT